MKPISDFIHNELYPRLFEVVDRAFPSMDFQLDRMGWYSPYKLNGARAHDNRRRKTEITRKVPTRIFEQGDIENNKDLISFYMELNSIPDTKEGLSEAVKQLSSLVGLSVPPLQDEGKYKAYEEKQRKLESISLRMREALYSDAGRGTLAYLREKRGYSDEFIKGAGFGFVAPDLRDELRDLFRYTNRDGVEVNLPYDIGISYFLSIPYRAGGNIQGFVFRTTLQDYAPKYKDAFISATASKKYHLFGLTGLRLTGNKERDRDITIVEGEIDALRAIYAGLPNVVAASGGNVSAEALQEAKSRGVKRVTLLFDTEATAEAQGRADTRIAKAIATIREAGLAPFVATFPSPDGGKVDADSYLQDHSKEELEGIIIASTSGARWMAKQLLTKALQGRKPEDLQDRERDELKRQTIELCNSLRSEEATDRAIILRELSEATNGYLSAEALQEEADILKLAQDRNRQQQETIDLSAEALRLANNGQTAEALSLIQKKAPQLQQISKEAEYSELLRLPTAETIKSSFKQRPTGIATPYVFEGSNGMEEQLILPTGALTYICAPTSHGKSRFLENLALNLANDGTEGDVLYFSFEEDSTAIQEQLLNIHADMTLSRNNTRTLRAYLRDGANQYFAYGVSIAELQAKEAELYSLLTTGKLRIYYRDYDSSELMEAIRYIAKQRRVKAVFVDYIQLLHTKGTRLQRREELGEMCKDFWRLAIELSIPIVLAAQLNREAYSPLDMTSQNIAEAADIERSANTIILLWNSSFTPIPQKNTYYKDKNGGLTEEAKNLQSRGFDIGSGGKIYAKISKNRGGSPNMEAIFDFNGNTGRIKPNYTQAEAEPQPQQEPQQGELWDEPSDQVQSSF